ncbi:DNA topoisomerase III [Acidithiobacillus ferriphilus]|uniref:DNA topoisomerase III n=1 Tax=Acidithiobacillus ferriphilus TaxID=1689834 RepID=UPI001C06F595|nr:DNA topoisomerase III [Acidithiobacillus ferriphilus]MBU2832997.1 DNA topoisomerase III [Acidithiobacillus ferriphilus]
MKLFIAEKPSLGKGIAQYLPGPHKTGNGCVECDGGKQVVTWAFGHIFEQVEPDFYTPDDVPVSSKGKKKWRWDELPILPAQWKLAAKDDAKAQIKVIRDLLKKADSVVNAGDPDREGQLLVDEILDECHWEGPTQRIWLAALDEQSVKKALANMKDNRDYQNLKLSAQARSRADWLMGMNLTRAFTLANRGSGVLSVGRVQTPTLRLIADRDNAIDHFKPKDFFVPRIQTAKAGTSFWSAWQVREIDGLDGDNQLIDKAVAEKLAATAKASGKAIVADYISKEQQQAAPLGFSLAELQKACSAKFGMSAKQTLDTAQALYEDHKCATYPRSDCRYLPEEQFGDAGKVLSGLSRLGYGDLVKGADAGKKSGIWNTAKVSAHHAIIPTGSMTGQLSGDHKKVFDLIVKQYIAQFYPPYVYKATKIVLECTSEKWTASGQVPVSAGWKAVFGVQSAGKLPDLENDSEAEEATLSLPVLTKGETLAVMAADVQAKQTQPPKRFTDGTLIEAMSNIHKYVEDPEAKKKLKETSGIGTEATRASIMETLLKRGFIERKGKQVVSSPAGRALIKALPDVLTNPVTTAQWEDVLGAIADGKVPADVFEQKQRDFVTKLVGVAKTSHITVGDVRPASSGGGSGPAGGKQGPKCNACGKANTAVLKTKTGKDWLKCASCGAAFWPSKDGKSCGTQWEKR